MRNGKHHSLIYDPPNLDGYSIYHDPDGFAYDIPLLRVHRATNQYERYDLKVSHYHIIQLVT